MNLEEVKQEIEQRTGVPASFLTGETAEENIAMAKALLAYKKKTATEAPRSTREQFAGWLQGMTGEAPQDAAEAALAPLEEALRAEAGGFPMTADAGEVRGMPDPRPAREQFADWFKDVTAFNPFKDNGAAW